MWTSAWRLSILTLLRAPRCCACRWSWLQFRRRAMTAMPFRPATPRALCRSRRRTRLRPRSCPTVIGCRHATSGDVTLHYRAPPRVVTASTRTGPLFDLRDEAGGVQGAGWTFLAVPVNTEPYRIQLHWDLSDMPAGSRGDLEPGGGRCQRGSACRKARVDFLLRGAGAQLSAAAHRKLRDVLAILLSRTPTSRWS